ncbi:hypothetical protein DFH06DRAFT_1331972 [Mycena polygramma]|nr:hypothetical protein DFH06DRAFT_1331972 [Mycena polygramma]
MACIARHSPPLYPDRTVRVCAEHDSDYAAAPRAIPACAHAAADSASIPGRAGIFSSTTPSTTCSDTRAVAPHAALPLMICPPMGFPTTDASTHILPELARTASHTAAPRHQRRSKRAPRRIEARYIFPNRNRARWLPPPARAAPPQGKQHPGGCTHGTHAPLLLRTAYHVHHPHAAPSSALAIPSTSFERFDFPRSAWAPSSARCTCQRCAAASRLPAEPHRPTHAHTRQARASSTSRLRLYAHAHSPPAPPNAVTPSSDTFDARSRPPSDSEEG